MGVEHKLLLQKSEINLDLICDFCSKQYQNFDVIDNQSIYLNDWGMTINLFKEMKREVWSSYVYDMDFFYDETVLFRMSKDSEYWEEQTRFIINCIFSMMSMTKQEGLFLYNLDTEICYFKPDGSPKIVDELKVIEKYLSDTIGCC